MDLTQALRVKRILEHEIVTGVLRAGEKLDEGEIARRCHVSRTPVREALLLLQAANLIDRKPRTGAVVRGQTLKVLIQTLELFSGLESLSGSLAARRLKPADLEAIDRQLTCCEAIAATGDADAYYDANLLLHYAIHSASYNDVLLVQIEKTGAYLQPFFRAQHHKPGWIEKTVTDHREVVVALHNRDSNAVDALLKRHSHFDSDDFADLAMRFD